ncbi:MAG: energy-coupling factor ABC transporter ATP-binding protein [Methanomicrobiales archaeon]|nr:energy-coupling factor ABC transporter ATP-binding protein [Methanomicrobiales archaeon]
MIRISGVRCRCLYLPDLTLPEGHTVVIGPNGSGKTTFLSLCAGFLLPEQGTIEIDNEPPRNRDVGFVGEFPERLALFSRVRDEIASSLRFSRVPADSIPAQIDAIAQVFGISPLLDRTTRTLSGGEIALVALATALISHPPILILDEFDSHLDWKSAQLVTTTLRSAPVRYRIQSTQNMDLAAKGDYVLYLDEGVVRLQGKPEEVFTALRDSCYFPPSWRFPP